MEQQDVSNLGNVRETNRVAKKVIIEGEEFYELTVVQEYHVDNVGNMLKSWTDEKEHLQEFILSHPDKQAEAITFAMEQLEANKKQIEESFDLSDEDIIAHYKAELKEKQAWLDNYEDFKEKAIKETKTHFEQMKQKAQSTLNNIQQGLTVWDNAL